ncbi:3-hydroxyacyl-CoA dehydrogenase [Roseospira navarrensis]|uniref:3-hydroxyacyl-CoA dehydrogenase n=1 Tax=Roseospira navarrensis TaxID=140058 RepID=A0A7X2D1S9_9PROT|nr:3-hydroxyacyl-CoA dehydrogenase [Roseospira navarrensis]
MRTVGVVGAGVMGRGIAQVLAQAGHTVRLTDRDPAAAEAARAFVADMLRRAAAKGRMTAAEAEATTARVVVCDGPAAMADADLVIEAVREDMAVKTALFQALEGIVRDDCILATNTSSLSVTAVAAGCRRPGRVAGFHFFNPVPLQRVVEVVAGERTEPAVIDTLCRVAEGVGHTAVRCLDSPGFLVNHAGRGFYTEGLRVQQEGIADPVTIDRILREAAGFRMGPFELFDLTGIDISFAVMEQVYRQFFDEPRLRPAPMARRRVDAGLYGRKAGRGFYAYPEGRQAVPPDPAVPDGPVPPVWLSPAEVALARPVRDLLAAGGVHLDGGARPGPESLCLVTPVDTDATSAAVAQGLDPTRTAAVDALFADGRLTLMLTAVTAPEARDGLRRALALTGRPVSVISDSVGFVAPRVVATIANIACEIAQQRIAAPDDVDRVVKIALGYPLGPLSLGEAMGRQTVLRLLEGMQAFYGDPRYRPSAWLRRRVLLDMPLTTREAEAVRAG